MEGDSIPLVRSLPDRPLTDSDITALNCSEPITYVRSVGAELNGTDGGHDDVILIINENLYFVQYNPEVGWGMILADDDVSPDDAEETADYIERMLIVKAAGGDPYSVLGIDRETFDSLDFEDVEA